MRLNKIILTIAIVVVTGAVVTLAIASGRADRAVLDQRRNVVEQLPATEKEELRKQFERFQKLPPEEQTKLREFDRKLASTYDEAELRKVMQHYHDWLATLSPLDRADLLKLPPQERVEKIKEMKDQELSRLAAQFSSPFVRLAPEDVRRILEWLEKKVDARKDAIMEQLTPSQKAWLDKQPADRQGRALLTLIYMHRRQDGESLFDVTAEETVEFEQGLSKELIAALHAAKSSYDRKALLRSIMFSALRARDTVRGSVSNDELLAHYQKLSPEKRNEIAAQPSSEFWNLLRRDYYRERSPFFVKGRRGPGPNGPDGPPFPPPGEGFGTPPPLPPFEGERFGPPGGRDDERGSPRGGRRDDDHKGRGPDRGPGEPGFGRGFGGPDFEGPPRKGPGGERPEPRGPNNEGPLAD
ncbi:MAG: hypothetical protein SGJ20_08405 [Planctomycetota bacterium]|nr:hypothetical protein [Planctomycetota bacterium]